MSVGKFVIYLGGRKFGIDTPDATVLGCTYDSAIKRLRHRGGHVYENEPGFGTEDFLAKYQAVEFGIGRAWPYPEDASDRAFRNALHDRNLILAPDGEEAFDDGSNILQIDTAEGVEVLGFLNEEKPSLVAASLVHLKMDAESFYLPLRDWTNWFEVETGHK